MAQAYYSEDIYDTECAFDYCDAAGAYVEGHTVAACAACGKYDDDVFAPAAAAGTFVKCATTGVWVEDHDAATCQDCLEYEDSFGAAPAYCAAVNDYVKYHDAACQDCLEYRAHCAEEEAAYAAAPPTPCEAVSMDDAAYCAAVNDYVQYHDAACQDCLEYRAHCADEEAAYAAAPPTPCEAVSMDDAAPVEKEDIYEYLARMADERNAAYAAEQSQEDMDAEIAAFDHDVDVHIAAQESQADIDAAIDAFEAALSAASSGHASGHVSPSDSVAANASEADYSEIELDQDELDHVAHVFAGAVSLGAARQKRSYYHRSAKSAARQVIRKAVAPSNPRKVARAAY